MENWNDPIDAYLTGRLTPEESASFEHRLAHDPQLRSEVALQREVVEGIRAVRKAELKARLRQVPVPPASSLSPALKWLAGASAVLGIAVAIYSLTPSPNTQTNTPPEKPAVQRADTLPEIAPTPEVTQVLPETRPEEKKSQATAPRQASEQPKDLPRKPSLEVVDFTDDTPNQAAEQVNPSRKPLVPAGVEVEMDSSNKKYNFHYQFSDSRLMLFGSFDRSLFEILEVNGDSRSLFLYYKGKFYVLDESKRQITPLEPITDPVLLKLLADYRK